MEPRKTGDYIESRVNERCRRAV